MTLSTRGRAPTFEDIRQVAVLVTATNSPTRIKRLADLSFVCDGIADEAQIQRAINLVDEEGGGIVLLSPGTFVITSSIDRRSKVYIMGAGDRVTTIQAGAASIRMVTNTTNLPVTGGGLSDLTLDGNDTTYANVTPLTLDSSQYGTFPTLRIINCKDKPAIELMVSTVAAGNTVANRFGFIYVNKAYSALKAAGLSSASTVVTNNTFVTLDAQDIRGTGIDLARWADNNRFGHVWLALGANSTYGVRHNTDTPGSNVGVYANDFNYLAIDSFGITGGTGIEFNTTKQNRVGYYFHSPEVFNGTLVSDVSGRSDSHLILNGQMDAALNEMEFIGTGIPGQVVTTYVTKEYTSDLFNAAGLTDSAAIWTQPAGSILVGARMALLTRFAATGMTDLDVTLGDGVDPDGIIATMTMNLTSDAVGSYYKTKGAYFDATAGTRYQAAATAWTAYSTAVGANLSTLTAGKVIFQFQYIEA